MNDLISRQAALKSQITMIAQGLDWIPAYHIEKLPSAERRGRWEMKEDPYGFFDTIPVCSACGCTTKYRVTSAYCPNCGAKMDEVEE